MNVKDRNKVSFWKRAIIYFSGFILIYYINLLPNINPYIFPILCFSIVVLLEAVDKQNSIFVLVKKRKYLRFIIGLVVAALYYALIYALMNEQVTLYGTRIIQSLMFVVYFFLVLFYVKKVHTVYPTKEEKLELLFKIAAIQGIICVAMLIIPSFKQLADNLFVMVSRFEEGDYILGTRVFGISNSYTYGLPILHGLLSGICFYMSIMIDKKYFKYLPFVAIVSLLNGRTGVIVALITMMMSLVYAFFVSKNKLRVMYLSLISVFTSVLAVCVLSVVSPHIYNFVNSAFTGIGEYIVGGESNDSIKALTGDSVYLPEGMGLIFGEGVRLYSSVDTSKYRPSDIGYVNDFFMGGLIYAILLYGSYFALIKSHYNEKNYRFIKYLIIVSIILANWKGEIFKNSTFIIGIFFILLSDISIEKEEKETGVCFVQ